MEFLLTPRELPAKFQEVDYAPKYKIWIEKIKKVEDTLNYDDLLKWAIGAFRLSQDKSAVTVMLPPPAVQAPKLVIELDEIDEVEIRTQEKEHDEQIANQDKNSQC
jgi:hypothetical protein